MVRIISSPKNRGNGTVVSAEINAASREIIIFRDADLKYNPSEYKKLLKPIEDKETNVANGVRFTKSSKQTINILYYLANRLLTLLINLLNKSNLNDMETVYKIFRKDIFEQLQIKIEWV